MTGSDTVHPVREYWERRYRKGVRGSGPGSIGTAAEQKAAFVNHLIAEHDVRRVIDWGCGDGIVAGMIASRRYVGLDVSERAIAICRERVKLPRRSWLWYDGMTAPELPPADMALSLDVIFHLTDYRLYRRYLKLVFGSAPLVVIHSSNRDEQGVPHVLHRTFLKDVPKSWRILHRPEDEREIGFWVFAKDKP
jgi:SAM-dependent methyltransferase